MTTGLVFDINEFAVHDGPGLRTTVFLKGCPLACAWCHNPEGQFPKPQVMHSAAGSRVAGTEYTAQELAAILNRQARLLKASEGGVTFSGGEPLLQSHFVAHVIDLLDDLHVLIDTSGYGRAEDLLLLLQHADLVFYDLKIMDREAHYRYTRVHNDAILRNLCLLGASGVPFVIRVPLVPGVTDTDENLAAIAQAIRTLPGLLRVELLPYNRAAGAKYRALGIEFQPPYDESRPLNVNTTAFEQYGIEVKVR